MVIFLNEGVFPQNDVIINRRAHLAGAFFGELVNFVYVDEYGPKIILVGDERTKNFSHIGTPHHLYARHGV